jgi:aminoglycoside phosphotransferase (APT) family kinase protein
VSQALLDILSEPRREAVRTALATTFGPATAIDAQPVLGGVSGALIYRIEVAGRPYALRLDRPADRLRDPHRHYACMRIAAEAGIAPALHYADPDGPVAIMDFVASRPLAAHVGGKDGLARELGGLLARLQETELFAPFADYGWLLERMLGFVRGSGMFAQGLLDRHLEGFQRLREAYPWDQAALVSSHNDPNFRNLLYDGERLWLVDWETAYRNDPMVDLAIQANELEAGPELADMLLTAWAGRAPDAQMRARLVLMRQLTRLYYAGLILSMLAGAPREAPDTDLTAPTPDEFRAAVAQGELAVGSPEMMYLLGKMMLAGFLAGMAAPEVEAAVQLCRG